MAYKVLLCTVPAVTKMLALRVISEMGANYHQRYFTFIKHFGINYLLQNPMVGHVTRRPISHHNPHAFQLAKLFRYPIGTISYGITSIL